MEKALFDNATNATLSTILTALKSFYVDDGLFSFPSESDLILFFKEIVPLLASRGFPLTKFFTTCDKLKKIIPKADLLPTKTLSFKDECCVQNTLGMTWSSSDDCFRFNCSFLDNPPVRLTRRVLLSVYSRIFDPLGFVQPFILQPKIIIQELCRLGLSWDEEVPTEIGNDWRKWLSNIEKIADYNFSRCVLHNCNYQSAEMHVFADASRIAYAVMSLVVLYTVMVLLC